ncbi:MAG: hypothetical protein M1586_00040 [Patescibacteria group bacterium]|nr:hypothetical protein [Patescibacteria group bacterium]MCL5261681.1 hypothetical protein [Patescibacteria group bacterium]
MEEKLKSVWKTPKLKLGVKALILAASFFYLPFWFAALVACVFYFFPALNTEKLITSFLISLFLGFVFSGIVPAADFWLIAGVIFYLLLGVKDMVFINRKFVYGLLFASVMIAAFLGVLAGAVSPWLLALLLLLLFREFFSVMLPDYPKRARLFAGAFTLIGFEIFSTCSWLDLPRVFINRLWISPWHADMLSALLIFGWIALPLNLLFVSLNGRIRPKIVFGHVAGMAVLIALTLVLVF